MRSRIHTFGRALGVSALLVAGLAMFAGCNDQAASNAFGPAGSPFLNGGGLTSFITAPGGLSDALFGFSGTTPTTGFGGTTGTFGGATINGTSGFTGPSVTGTTGAGGTLGGLSSFGGMGTTTGTGFTTNPAFVPTGGLGLGATNNAFGAMSLTNTVPTSSFGSLSGLPFATSPLAGTSLSGTTTVNGLNAITQTGF